MRTRRRILVELGIDAGAHPRHRRSRVPSAACERGAGGRDPSRGGPRHRARGRGSAIALRHWDIGVDPSQWEEQVALALDAFLERHGGVAVFVPFQALGEDLVNDVGGRAARARAPARTRPRTVLLEGASSPAEKAAVLAGCDVVLGMRLHSLVFAMSAGVAAVALAYDPKVRAAMAEAGAPEQVIALDGVTRRARWPPRCRDAYAQRAAIGRAARRRRRPRLAEARGRDRAPGPAPS